MKKGGYMSEQNDQFLILEQYRIYSDAKEKFIERQFASNRFYLVLNIVVLAIIYFIITLVPNSEKAIIVLNIIGILVSIMWWVNVDSYQLLIKVKYAKVLEYMEDKLPEKPYQKEFSEYTQMKNKKKLIVFGDFQKYLSLGIGLVYVFTCFINVINIIKYTYLG